MLTRSSLLAHELSGGPTELELRRAEARERKKTMEDVQESLRKISSDVSIKLSRVSMFELLNEIMYSSGGMDGPDIAIQGVNGNDGCKAVAKDLQEKEYIDKLSLKGRHIGKEGMDAICAVVLSKRVQSLSFDGADIGLVLGGPVRTMLLSTHCNLVYLCVCGNNLGDDGACDLAQGLLGNCCLQRLDARRNRIEIIGMQALCGALQDNSTLLELELAETNICVQSIATISQALTNNQSLQRLQLVSSSFGLHHIEHLASAVEINRNLLHLTLGDIDPQGAPLLFRSLSRTVSLQELFVGSIDLECIPMLCDILRRNVSLKCFACTTTRNNCDESVSVFANAAAVVYDCFQHSLLDEMNIRFDLMGLSEIWTLGNELMERRLAYADNRLVQSSCETRFMKYLLDEKDHMLIFTCVRPGSSDAQDAISIEEEEENEFVAVGDFATQINALRSKNLLRHSPGLKRASQAKQTRSLSSPRPFCKGAEDMLAPEAYTSRRSRSMSMPARLPTCEYSQQSSICNGTVKLSTFTSSLTETVESAATTEMCSSVDIKPTEVPSLGVLLPVMVNGRLPSIGALMHPHCIICVPFIQGRCSRSRNCHKCHAPHRADEVPHGGGARRQRIARKKASLRRIRTPSPL